MLTLIRMPCDPVCGVFAVPRYLSPVWRHTPRSRSQEKDDHASPADPRNTNKQVRIAVDVAKASWPRVPAPSWANIYLAFFNVHQWYDYDLPSFGNSVDPAYPCQAEDTHQYEIVCFICPLFLSVVCFYVCVGVRVRVCDRVSFYVWSELFSASVSICVCVGVSFL